ARPYKRSAAMERYRSALPMLLICGVLGVTRADGLPKEGPMTFILTSTAFAAGAAIPAKYTCEGPGVSPPLAWQGVPAGARSLVLIEDDPDAPDPAAPKTTWVHWLLYNLPPTSRGLPEDAS